MEYLKDHEEIRNRDGRELTGIKSENIMKRVFLRLKDAGLLEPVPNKFGSASAWRKKRRDPGNNMATENQIDKN